MIFSGGIDGSLVIWKIPENSRFDLNEPYLDSESPSMGIQVAVWDKCHENQPIWDIKFNTNGNLISVGSDQSVGLWRAPTAEEADQQSPGL